MVSVLPLTPIESKLLVGAQKSWAANRLPSRRKRIVCRARARPLPINLPLWRAFRQRTEPLPYRNPGLCTPTTMFVRAPLRLSALFRPFWGRSVVRLCVPVDAYLEQLPGSIDLGLCVQMRDVMGEMGETLDLRFL